MPILSIPYRIIALLEKTPRDPIYSPLTPVPILERRPDSQRILIPILITLTIQKKRII
jgi:hypothetical protein